MTIDFLAELDTALAVSKQYRLTREEKAFIAKEEQGAYKSKLDEITTILKEYEDELSQRGFWTESNIQKNGLRFRYSLDGYYGPGGFSSQFHIAGPLVLGVINPKGDAFQSFYSNDVDKNIKIGADFNAIEFRQFVENNIREYVAPENLVITKDQYDWIRALYPRQ